MFSPKFLVSQIGVERAQTQGTTKDKDNASLGFESRRDRYNGIRFLIGAKTEISVDLRATRIDGEKTGRREGLTLRGIFSRDEARDVCVSRGKLFSQVGRKQGQTEISS